MANTGGNFPFHGRHVCRVVQPVTVDEGVLVVEGLGPVGFRVISQHTTLAWSSTKTGDQVWFYLINRLLRQALRSCRFRYDRRRR